LDDDMRKQEIARMLSGKDITQKTIEHAAEFLKKGQAR
jgi:DNA repair ATPase RecN